MDDFIRNPLYNGIVKNCKELRGKTTGLFLCPKGGVKCQRNLKDHVLFLVVLS
jgi:hypothetical protein